MFCPNCGNNCGDANFCPKCGFDIRISVQHSHDPKPHTVEENCTVKKISAAQEMIYAANDARQYERVPGYIPAHKLIDVNASDIPVSKKEVFRMRKKELESSGQVFCPKCLSTSISANQKGFSFIRGAIGASIGLDVGLITGGIGSKKVICTCLKGGYQWKPGKK